MPGNRASGWPNVIAMMSMTYWSRMLAARRRKRMPSRRDSHPGFTISPSGRIEGSVQSPRNSDVMRTTSIEYVQA
ncbi:hypothetical protein QE381_001252 [Microbacterium sp. SORGH_AS 888]|nr:hypothetical protein [Microbacterium sp. SORGH_AS_0888]